MADHVIDPVELQEYLDGRLEGNRLACVEAALLVDADAWARVAAYRQNDARLRRAFADADAAPMPAGIAAALSRSRRVAAGGVSLRQVLTRLAGVVLVASLAAVAGWSANVWYAERPAVQAAEAWARGARDAMAAHRLYAAELAHPVEFATGQQELSRLIARRLGQPALMVPDLSAQGFHVLGARFLPAGGDIAAMAMYETDAGDRVTFYVRNRQSGEAPLSWLFGHEVGSFYWVDDGCLYVIAGKLTREQLQDLAISSHTQLEGRS